MENSRPNKKSVSRWLFAITFLLAAGLLYLALRKVSWSELLSTLRQGNLALLGLAAALLSASCVVRALRWRLLLSAAPDLPPETRLPLADVFWATMTGYLGNAYLPARAGEVVRSVLIGQQSGISKSFSLATALTERIVDAVILVVAGSLALSTLPVLPAQMSQAMRAMGALGLFGAALILLAPRANRLVDWVLTRLPLSASLRAKLSNIAHQFLLGAGALQQWIRLGLFLLASASIWTIDTMCGFSIAMAFGLALNPLHVFILLAAVGLASALPSTPGYIGVYQFVAVIVLVPFGLSQAQAVAYMLAYQGVQYSVISVWGLIGLWMLRGAVSRRKKPAAG